MRRHVDRQPHLEQHVAAADEIGAVRKRVDLDVLRWKVGLRDGDAGERERKSGRECAPLRSKALHVVSWKLALATCGSRLLSGSA
jgi:hypothetical protein